MSLFHKDIHAWVRDISFGDVDVNWTRHGLDQAVSKGLTIVNTVTVRNNVFEVEKNRHGDMVKFCVRVPMNDTHDLCLVLVPHDGVLGRFRVVTAWANSRHDTHRTLDRSKYSNRVA